MKENRGRPKENVEKKMKFTVDYGDSRWHYDLNKYPRGPYLVEQLDTTYEKLEYHENGRKKRIKKSDRKKMELVEKAYWKEHYRLFPDERPKRRGRKPIRG